MAEQQPSLTEITNIARDPGEGSVSPRALINTQDLVHTVNQAAQFKAENDWRKYGSFMNELKGVYKQLGEIQGLEVAQADRPYLQKQAADIFGEISKDPHGFFGGKMADIEKKIGALRSQSTQSVQDKVFDDAHRAYIERDPTLQTDENKGIIDGYFKQPLGQRKPYMLKLPSLYNPQAIAEQINAAIPQKFSQTTLSPDGKFLNTTTGIRYDEKQFKTLADQMFMMPDPKTGRSIGQEAADRLKALPPALQDHYRQKYPEDPVKGFYDETVMPWRKKDEVSKNEPKANPFALEQEKARDKSAQLAQKFGYDKIIEEMKLGGQRELAMFKESLKNKTKKEQTGALNGMVDTMVNDAIGKGAGLSPEEQKFWGVGDGYFKMDVSPATLKIFSTTKGAGSLKKTEHPDQLLVSADGQKVKAIYYKQGGKEVDKDKTSDFSIDEFKVRFGKDVLGVSATEKEINDDSDDGESSSETSITTESKSSSSKPKTVVQGGYTYTMNEKTGKYE
jgi:hypothetical protein